jgi:ElaA protein
MPYPTSPNPNAPAAADVFATGLHWWARAFDALTVGELDAVYRARQQVFCLEQQCVFVDADGCDAQSLHLAAWRDGGELPLAYARVVAPGVKYAEPSIGRVLTMLPARRSGLGRELVGRAVRLCTDTYPGRLIRIGAQSRLEHFYAGFGFTAIGRPYIEDGIAHTEMLLRPG